MPTLSQDIKRQLYYYPAELIDVVHLAEGQRVIIRPVLAQDQELIAAFFHDLSADGRCSRFLHPVNEPSFDLLRQFTQVDYVNHVALVATIFVDGRETIIGEARYVRDADASSAEFAVSVAESWQRKGLAKLMLAKLEFWAAANGVPCIVAETLVTNKKILSFARKLGYVLSWNTPGVMRFEKKLAMSENSIPGRSTALRHEAILGFQSPRPAKITYRSRERPVTSF
jgi:RimJ/RimL family protein N-acetyltransferase